MTHGTKLFSVIIPSFNGSERVQKLLTQLKNQTLNSDLYEVVLVVDHGEEEKQQLYRDAIKASGITNITPVMGSEKKEYANAAFPRNRGLRNATGKYFVFLDDDMIISETFLEGYKELIDVHPEAIICGDIKHPTPENHLQRFLVSSKTYFGFHGLKHGEECGFSYFFTGNSCIPAEVFKETQFNELPTYGYEDLIFAYEVSQKGLKFYYNQRSSGIHNDKVKFYSLYKRKFSAASHAHKIAADYPGLAKLLHVDKNIKKLRYFPIQFVPPEWFLNFVFSLTEIFCSITRFRNIYRYILAFAFLSGMAYGLNKNS
jgi:glycosyltransferase involved in cell wall biosynthesis